MVGPALAPDAAQDAWLSIQRSLHTLREPARFAPWAFGILRRRCADSIRTAVRDRATEAADAEDHHTPEPLERMAIAAAMADLPGEQRLAAHLFFVEGLTLAEIAMAQAVPLGTAKSRLFHARRQLKAALSGDTP
ncbi:hypothetical protein GCM10022213_26010 [Parerythrobacter jejuensis]